MSQAAGLTLANADEPADDTRSRLLRATAAILSERGYSETKLGDIASAARLKAPAIYYHFAGRDALITAALVEGQVLVREHVLTALANLPATADPRMRILAAVDAHLRVELELSEFAAAVVRTSAHVPERIKTALAADTDAYYDVWRDLLAAAEREGLLRDGMDSSVARMLVLGALNWTVEWCTPTTSVDDVVSNATTLIAGALFIPS